VLRRVAAKLADSGEKVVTTYDPGDTKLSNKLRSIVKADFDTPITNRAMLYLYCAARSQLVAEVIQPALDAGNIVLSDRFSDSTIVYQGMIHDLADNNFVKMVHYASFGLIPDKTFLLDVPVDIGLARIKVRDTKDRFDSMGKDFHEQIRKCYLMLAERYKRRVIIMDSTLDVDTLSDLVYTNIKRAIRRNG